MLLLAHMIVNHNESREEKMLPSLLFLFLLLWPTYARRYTSPDELRQSEKGSTQPVLVACEYLPQVKYLGAKANYLGSDQSSWSVIEFP